MSDVRVTPSTPVVGNFADKENTPIVIDSSNGAAYCLKTGDVMVEIGRDAGWSDMLASLSAGKAVGANAPTWATIRDALAAYRFDAGVMNELWVSLHVPHEYLSGTMLYPHIHWVKTGTNTGTVRWGVEYSSARGYDIEAFPASTTIYIEQAGSATAYQHMIAEQAEGAGVTVSNLEPDSLLLMRLFRDAAHVNDTCTEAVFGLFLDVHYQSDGMLTNERNRTFTKKRGMF